MLGLDAAGKTTILYKLKAPIEQFDTIPTIGFNVENYKVGNVNLTLWDGGYYNLQVNQRGRMRHYYVDTKGLIFVIDSKDSERIQQNAEYLQQLLSEESLNNIPVLVYANKSDLNGIMSPAEIVQLLDLQQYKGLKWMIQSTVGTTGQGLHEGLDWLTNAIQQNQKSQEQAN
eukprot:403370234